MFEPVFADNLKSLNPGPVFFYNIIHSMKCQRSSSKCKNIEHTRENLKTRVCGTCPIPLNKMFSLKINSNNMVSTDTGRNKGKNPCRRKPHNILFEPQELAKRCPNPVVSCSSHAKDSACSELSSSFAFLINLSK